VALFLISYVAGHGVATGFAYAEGPISALPGGSSIRPKAIKDIGIGSWPKAALALCQGWPSGQPQSGS
jgi:hypothetical protein